MISFGMVAFLHGTMQVAAYNIDPLYKRPKILFRGAYTMYALEKCLLHQATEDLSIKCTGKEPVKPDLYKKIYCLLTITT